MKKFVLVLMILPVIFTSCEDNKLVDFGPYQVLEPKNPIPKGARMFGINLSESKFGFEASFTNLQEAGTDMVEINIPWNAIETSKGKYTDPWGGVIAATSYYGANHIKVCFSIALINTVKWEIPEYLSDADPSSSEFINAFTSMMDWFMKTVPENVTIPGISIGNEVDLVLEGADEWAAYTTFYEAAVQHMHQNYPGIKIGVKSTVRGGLYTINKANVIAINEHSDVVMLNYYPMNEDYQVKLPEVVHDDFARIVNYFPRKEIWMAEVGYQSGTKYCNSTKTKQAHFYHELFEAWDTHKNDITVVLVNWLHDQAPETIEAWKDYYGNDPALVEYLSTLGLRNYDGSAKAAWEQVMKELETREW